MARKILVSAGSSGIGRCIAEAFLKQGDDVFVCDITQNALKNQSLKYFVNPNHIADLCVFLASESGRSISGQILPIDGDKQCLS